MKDDVAILMDQFIKKLQEKGYLEDNGMYNLDTLQKETGYDYYYLMCSNNWNTLYILPRNPTEVKYVFYEMYKIPRYSELEHAAELLADNEFDDI